MQGVNSRETMEKEETYGNALDFSLGFAVNLKKLLKIVL